MLFFLEDRYFLQTAIHSQSRVCFPDRIVRSLAFACRAECDKMVRIGCEKHLQVPLRSGGTSLAPIGFETNARNVKVLRPLFCNRIHTLSSSVNERCNCVLTINVFETFMDLRDVCPSARAAHDNDVFGCGHFFKVVCRGYIACAGRKTNVYFVSSIITVISSRLLDFLSIPVTLVNILSVSSLFPSDLNTTIWCGLNIVSAYLASAFAVRPLWFGPQP